MTNIPTHQSQIPPALSPQLLLQAVEELCSRDSDLAGAVTRHGPPPMWAAHPASRPLFGSCSSNRCLYLLRRRRSIDCEHGSVVFQRLGFLAFRCLRSGDAASRAKRPGSSAASPAPLPSAN